MTRDEAWTLVCEKIKSEPMRAHLLASEACMRAVARKLGEDEEVWGLTGLVHDCDMEDVGGDHARHGIVGADLLAAQGLPEEIVHAVRVHPGHGERLSLLDKGLWAVDPTTGFILAAVLVLPTKKLMDLQVSSIKKRMKDKRFAAAVNRDQIRASIDIGIELDEFLQICLDAMREVAPTLGH